ncbi:MAG: hypothetical protein ACRDD7_08205 [Peptostreptococcaceae bacterium]
MKKLIIEHIIKYGKKQVIKQGENQIKIQTAEQGIKLIDKMIDAIDTNQVSKSKKYKKR